MIEVFKTNVNSEQQAREIVAMLKDRFGYARVSFDLGDCDRVLRIESSEVRADSVIGLLHASRVECDPLPD